MKKLVMHTVFLFLIADLLLTLSGYRVIFDQKVVQPGEHFVADQFGDISTKKTATLVCRYWNGTSRRSALFEYGGKGDARQKCPVYLAAG